MAKTVFPANMNRINRSKTNPSLNHKNVDGYNKSTSNVEKMKCIARRKNKNNLKVYTDWGVRFPL